MIKKHYYQAPLTIRLPQIRIFLSFAALRSRMYLNESLRQSIRPTVRPPVHLSVYRFVNNEMKPYELRQKSII